MIISRLTGGLGNQMFQYAIGRSLSLKNNSIYKLDISEYNSFKHHNGYHLNIFENDFLIASNPEIYRLKNRRSLYSKILNKLNISFDTHYREHDFYRFDKKIYNMNGQIYLDGYWQNEKYFKDKSNFIINDFTFKPEISTENLDHLNHIKSTKAVSIHIRRGDYISNINFSKVHNTLDLDYYKKAISIINTKIDNPFFFIFSDDLKWAKYNLDHLQNKKFIINNQGANSHEDMRLMSECKHNIIANSSFSWWGAWLNRHESKIVISPNRWLKVTKIDTSDLIPHSWIRI
jgi:hypothetical protein